MRDINRVVRYMAYSLELLVLFMLQEVPGLFPGIYGARPVLLFDAAITIAMFEEEVPALFFGVAAGLFCDFGLMGVLGFHALILGLLSFIVSLQARAFLQVNLLTALATALWTIGVTILAQWVFLYVLRYSQPAFAFTHHFAPKFLYTMLFVPLIYLLNHGLSSSLKAAA